MEDSMTSFIQDMEASTDSADAVASAAAAALHQSPSSVAATNISEEEERFWEALVTYGLGYELRHADNPYLTTETLALRVCNRFLTKVGMPNLLRHLMTTGNNHSSYRVDYFRSELAQMYSSIRHTISPEDQICVERILSRDFVHPTELSKFANFWYKRDAPTVLRWFAIDGYLGDQVKPYVQETFRIRPNNANNNDSFKENHITAVRMLYQHELETPHQIRSVVEAAFAWKLSDYEAIDSVVANTSDYYEPDEQLIKMYVDMLGSNLKKVYDWKREQLQKRQESTRTRRSKKSSMMVSSPTVDVDTAAAE